MNPSTLNIRPPSRKPAGTENALNMTVSDPLELARLIEADLAHWWVCQQRPCAECEFIEKILALAENMIFSEQTRDVHSFGGPSNGRSSSRAIKGATPARSLHAKLDWLAHSRTLWWPLVEETIEDAYKRAKRWVAAYGTPD